MADGSASSLAAHYRKLALEAYAAAQLIEQPRDRLIMQHIGFSYENLAAHAERRAQAKAKLAGAWLELEASEPTAGHGTRPEEVPPARPPRV